MSPDAVVIAAAILVAGLFGAVIVAEKVSRAIRPLVAEYRLLRETNQASLAINCELQAWRREERDWAIERRQNPTNQMFDVGIPPAFMESVRRIADAMTAQRMTVTAESKLPRPNDFYHIGTLLPEGSRSPAKPTPARKRTGRAK